MGECGYHGQGKKPLSQSNKKIIHFVSIKRFHRDEKKNSFLPKKLKFFTGFGAS